MSKPIKTDKIEKDMIPLKILNARLERVVKHNVKEKRDVECDVPHFTVSVQRTDNVVTTIEVDIVGIIGQNNINKQWLELVTEYWKSHGGKDKWTQNEIVILLFFCVDLR